MTKKFIYLFIIFSLFFLAPLAEARSSSDTQRALGFERYYGLLPDEAMQKRIAALGEKLVSASGLKQEDFTFKVINSAEVNAVTLPGGYIYVYKGLIDFMPTDDELAAVIGHEIGHVTGKHLARREREQILTLLIGALLGGPEAGIAANAALASLPAYSQRDEREADDSGFRYLVEAGMNPYAMLVVMYKLGETENAQIRSNFAVHPEPLVRAQRINRYLEQLKTLPEVSKSRDLAYLRDDSWTFTVRQADQVNTPFYRALLLAGNLYVIANQENLRKENFIVVENLNSADIYYQDKLIYSVIPADVLQDNKTLAQKAAEYIENFRFWAELKTNKNSTS